MKWSPPSCRDKGRMWMRMRGPCACPGWDGDSVGCPLSWDEDAPPRTSTRPPHPAPQRPLSLQEDDLDRQGPFPFLVVKVHQDDTISTARVHSRFWSLKFIRTGTTRPRLPLTVSLVKVLQKDHATTIRKWAKQGLTV